MTRSRDNPFWNYSLALYARAEVAKTCLALQDRLGLDVNVLLFCCWAGSRGRTLSRDEIEGLIAATRGWREQVVLPLRGVRRRLKSDALELGPAAQALRADVKSAELAAEAIQQDLMHKALTLPKGPTVPEIVAANLRAYLAAHDCSFGTAESEDLATILRGACPDVASAEARRLLQL